MMRYKKYLLTILVLVLITLSAFSVPAKTTAAIPATAREYRDAAAHMETVVHTDTKTDIGTDTGTDEKPLPVESQEPPPKLVALTFDDGPSSYTGGLLDKLNAHGVTATFFVLGSCAERYPDTIRRMAEEGFEIGIHTYSHQNMTSMSRENIQYEITRTIDAISNASVPVLLRPPYGSYNKTVQGVCAENELSLALWSVDTLDWKSRNVDSILDTAFYSTYSIQDGSIVLMHDLYETTINAVDPLIEKLKEEGYTFVTVSQMLEIYSGGAIPGGVYYSGYK